mgnify:CR=1 FL=1
MKNTIAIKKNFFKDLSVTAYKKMLGRICSKHCISGLLLSNC